MTIWDFNEQVSKRLLGWNAFNFVVGVVLMLAAWAGIAGNRGDKLRGFASQFAGWAVINALIAIGGSWGTRRRRQGLGAAADQPDRLAKEARNLRLLLWVNTGLDVVYMIGGARLARAGKRDVMRGVGWGIIFQGAFLFVFDLVHALLVPPQGDDRERA